MYDLSLFKTYFILVFFLSVLIYSHFENDDILYDILHADGMLSAAAYCMKYSVKSVFCKAWKIL